MKPEGDRKNLKKILKDFLKVLRRLARSNPQYDLSFEEYMKLESKKTRTPPHKRF